jgi:dUTPase
MQLTGEEARRLGFVTGIRKPANVRAATIDLTVGRIIVGGREHALTSPIEPQQMFTIISNETISVPRGFVGHALPKTYQAQRGMLTINTGIVDPEYTGPLSTTAINFSSHPLVMSKEEVFLRLVFFRLDPAGPPAIDPACFSPLGEAEVYYESRRKESATFPKTFLDIPGQVAELSRGILGRQMTQFVAILTIFTVILGLWSFALSTGVFEFHPRRQTVEEVMTSLDRMNARLDVLESSGQGRSETSTAPKPNR